MVTRCWLWPTSSVTLSGLSNMIQPDDHTQQVDKIAPHMVGNTFKKIDEKSVNCLNIEFTDGTELLLEVEAVNGPIGLYGISGYIRK